MYFATFQSCLSAYQTYIACAGDAAGRPGGPAGGSAVGRLSVCPPVFLRDDQQPAVIRWVRHRGIYTWMWTVGVTSPEHRFTNQKSSCHRSRWSSRCVLPRGAGAAALLPQRRCLSGRLHRTALQLLLSQSVAVLSPAPSVWSPLLWSVPIYLLLEVL